jgi:replicative DNA helicase
MSERLPPPHDLDAEGAVLSAMMLDRNAVDIGMHVLEPDHFFAESNRRIFEAVTELATKDRPIDLVTVIGILRDRNRLEQVGGSAYVAQIIDSTPAIAHIEAHALAVRNKWSLRNAISVCKSIAAEAYGHVEDAQLFLDEAEQKIFECSKRSSDRIASPITDVMHAAYARMCAAEARGGTVELPTGLAILDKKIGGLGRGRQTVIAARPGMGKTSLATGIAENIASLGMPVLIASIEMPGNELGMRMACTRAGASVIRGLNGWLAPEERSMVLRAMDELSRLPVFIDDTASTTLMRIRAQARMLAARIGKPLGLVVVDYLQLITTEWRKGVTRDREVSEITAGLKRMAKELNCAVLLLSQLNREVESEKDRRPRLNHLRESGGIEQDADDVIFIYRDDYYNPDSDEQGIAELIVAKQRNGPTGMVKVRFEAASTAFINLQETA